MFVIPFSEDLVFRLFGSTKLDDSVDRLSYMLTSTLLLFFAVVVGGKQYSGTPIDCWLPQEYKGAWKQYAESYCFTKKLYYVPLEDAFPEDMDERNNNEINYYQWVPFALALQALFFYIPHLLFRTQHKRGQYDWDTIDQCIQMKFVMKDNSYSLQLITDLLRDMFGVIERRRDRRGSGKPRFVALLNILCKVLNLLNVIGQLYVMKMFLGADTNFLGIQLLRDSINDRTWMDNGLFPRVTRCDFKVRALGQIHQHTVQCVIMINMLNENIYLFLWFWMAFVLVVTAVNVIYSSIIVLSKYYRKKTMRSMIEANDVTNEELTTFTEDLLGMDAVLLFTMIRRHAGPVLAKEIVSVMFRDFRIDEENRETAAGKKVL